VRKSGAGGRSRGSRPDRAWITGRRAVLEAIRAGRAGQVMISDAAVATPALRAILELTQGDDIPVLEVTREALDRLGPDHQGVAARVRKPAAITDSRLRSWAFGPDDVVVVLDGITDPQNLGAAARAAEGAGVVMLVMRERRAAGVSPAAIRASAGALLHLPHARVTNLSRSLQRLKDVGFSVVGLDEDAPLSIYDRPCPEGRVALVVGSEGEGLSRLVRETCDVLVGLPMRGHVSSLNASASLAAALFGYVLPSRKPVA